MSNPVTAGQQIMSAIAAKANGIVVTGIDCAAIQNALTAANAAGVKSIDLGGEQCSPPLYTAQARIGGLPYEQGTTNVYDLNRIDWGIDQTHGNMKLIIVNISDFSAVSLQTAAILKDLKVCPTCSVLDTVNLSIANLPALAQLLPAALNQYPQANAIWLYDGSALELGAQAAIENAGRATGAKRLVVIAGTCAYGEPALIRAGWDIGCDAFSNQWDGWQSMDFLNRLFAGETPAKLPTVGTGLQIIDATHNLPKGSAWVPPLNFEAGYEKVWSGK
jgi:ribose transport system substrate-binding protein